jgi:hypothetical protein
VRAAGWIRTPDPRDSPNEASLRFRHGRSDCLFNVNAQALLLTDAESRVLDAVIPKAGESRYHVFVMCMPAMPAAADSAAARTSLSTSGTALAAHASYTRPDAALAWTRVLPWASGAFQESWTAGRVPLAIKPLVGPGSRLWMVGGRGVWKSVDGIDWKRTTDRLPWGERYGAATEFFRGELWSTGGEVDRVRRNDVYRSRDGITWTRAAAPPWSPRRAHTLTVFDDKLWVIGGSDTGNHADVWESGDGTTWKRATASAPWGARGNHATIAWRNRLCVIGGSNEGTVFADIWCSPDGREWTRIDANAWPPRVRPGVVVFDDRLWLLGGSAANVEGDAAWLNDIWTSTDGVRWTKEPQPAPWSRRAPEYSVVYRDKLWIFGGKGIEATGRGGFADDVWAFAAAALLR